MTERAVEQQLLRLLGEVDRWEGTGTDGQEIIRLAQYLADGHSASFAGWVCRKNYPAQAFHEDPVESCPGPHVAVYYEGPIILASDSD